MRDGIQCSEGRDCKLDTFRMRSKFDPFQVSGDLHTQNSENRVKTENVPVFGIPRVYVGRLKF